MDWESWLRGDDVPPLKQKNPNKKNGTSLAELLGLPVVLRGGTAESRNAAADAGEPHQGSQTGDSLDDIVSDAEGTMPSLPQTPEISEESSVQSEVTYPVVSEVVDATEDEHQVPVPESVEETKDTIAAQAMEEDSISDRINGEQPTFSETESNDDPFISSGGRDEPVSVPVQEENEENGTAISTFTIPAYPLYPLSEDDPAPDKALFIETNRTYPKPQREKTKKNRVLLICFLAVALVMGGLFLMSGESFETLLQQGDQAYTQKEYDQALIFYEKAAEKKPLRVEPLFRKARTLEEMGRKGEAVHAWNSCLKITPEDAEIYRRLGALLFELGSLDNAIRNYQESVRFEPENAETHFRLGSLLESREDYPQALESYRKALEIDAARSEFVEAVERTEKEVHILEEERRLQTALAEEQIQLGAAFLVTGEYLEAEGHFLRAVDLVPESEDGLLGLAEARIGKGDIEGAKETYHRLLVFAPHSEKAKTALLALEPPATERIDTVLSDDHSTPPVEQHGYAADGVISSDIISGGPTILSDESEEAGQSEDVSGSGIPLEKTIAETLGEDETRPPVIPPGSSVTPLPISSAAEEASPPSSGEVIPEKQFSAVRKTEQEDSSQVLVVSSEIPLKNETSLSRDGIPGTAELIPEKTKEPPIKKTETPKTSFNGRVVKATVSRTISLPRRSQKTSAPSETRQNTRSTPALKKNEESILETSRSYNLSGEYLKAAEKASEALRFQQSPEALSNLGYAHIGLRNYPAAFTAYWRRLLLSPKLRKPSLEPPAFLSLPFKEGRWKEIPVPNPRDLPVVVRSEKMVLLPGGNAVLSGVLPGKEYLFEALRINPAEKDVYLNLALSYVMMKNQGVSSPSFSTAVAVNENENALYLALLAHALRSKKADEQSEQFLNAAAVRASGEVLRFVRSLETHSVSGIK